jgi:hypothetical protein
VKKRFQNLPFIKCNVQRYTAGGEYVGGDDKEHVAEAEARGAVQLLLNPVDPEA